LEKATQNFRLQVWITCLSVTLFIIKIIAFYLTHSLAILSDALESIVNVLAGFIGLYSLYVAAKPKDIEHPYGHGKAEFVSAAAEGTLIFASGILIIYETVVNIIEKSPLESLNEGIWLISFTGLLNYIAGSVCIWMGKKNNSLALKASGKHLHIDTYSTIGILAGLFLIIITHFVWIDKAIAIIISIIILFNGYKIIRASLAGIMDEADKKLLNTFVAFLNKKRKENWIDVHNLRVIRYGNTLHVDCHLTVPWYFNIHEAHNEVEALEQLINEHFEDSIELFVHTDGCLEFSCGICMKNNCEKRQHPFTKKIEWIFNNIVSDQKHNADI
jgi:cation diffusion facilitator family transporter